MVRDLAPPGVFARYQGYLTKAFVEDSLDLQWCPHDGCHLVIKKPAHIKSQKVAEEDAAGAGEGQVGEGGGPATKADVMCGNGHPFCWHCRRDPHAPADCNHMEQFEAGTKMKEVSVSEEDARELAQSTRLCPKCGIRIYRYDGCNTMCCEPPQGCGHSFCWVCLKPMAEDERGMGGHDDFFRCNQTDVDPQAIFEENLKAARDLALVHSSNATSNRLKANLHHEWGLLENSLQGRFLSPPAVMSQVERASRLLQCAAIYDYFKLDQGSIVKSRRANRTARLEAARSLLGARLSGTGLSLPPPAGEDHALSLEGGLLYHFGHWLTAWECPFLLAGEGVNGATGGRKVIIAAGGAAETANAMALEGIREGLDLEAAGGDDPGEAAYQERIAAAQGLINAYHLPLRENTAFGLGERDLFIDVAAAHARWELERQDVDPEDRFHEQWRWWSPTLWQQSLTPDLEPFHEMNGSEFWDNDSDDSDMEDHNEYRAFNLGGSLEPLAGTAQDREVMRRTPAIYTVSGSGVDGVDGVYYRAGLLHGRTCYLHNADGSMPTIPNNDAATPWPGPDDDNSMSWVQDCDHILAAVPYWGREPDTKWFACPGRAPNPWLDPDQNFREPNWLCNNWFIVENVTCKRRQERMEEDVEEDDPEERWRKTMTEEDALFAGIEEEYWHSAPQCDCPYRGQTAVVRVPRPGLWTSCRSGDHTLAASMRVEPGEWDSNPNWQVKPSSGLQAGPENGPLEQTEAESQPAFTKAPDGFVVVDSSLNGEAPLLAGVSGVYQRGVPAVNPNLAFHTGEGGIRDTEGLVASHLWFSSANLIYPVGNTLVSQDPIYSHRDDPSLVLLYSHPRWILGQLFGRSNPVAKGQTTLYAAPASTEPSRESLPPEVGWVNAADCNPVGLMLAPIYGALPIHPELRTWIERPLPGVHLDREPGAPTCTGCGDFMTSVQALPDLPARFLTVSEEGQNMVRCDAGKYWRCDERGQTHAWGEGSVLWWCHACEETMCQACSTMEEPAGRPPAWFCYEQPFGERESQEEDAPVRYPPADWGSRGVDHRCHSRLARAILTRRGFTVGDAFTVANEQARQTIDAATAKLEAAIQDHGGAIAPRLPPGPRSFFRGDFEADLLERADSAGTETEEETPAAAWEGDEQPPQPTSLLALGDGESSTEHTLAAGESICLELSCVWAMEVSQVRLAIKSFTESAPNTVMETAGGGGSTPEPLRLQDASGTVFELKLCQGGEAGTALMVAEGAAGDVHNDDEGPRHWRKEYRIDSIEFDPTQGQLKLLTSHQSRCGAHTAVFRTVPNHPLNPATCTRCSAVNGERITDKMMHECSPLANREASREGPGIEAPCRLCVACFDEHEKETANSSPATVSIALRPPGLGGQACTARQLTGETGLLRQLAAMTAHASGPSVMMGPGLQASLGPDFTLSDKPLRVTGSRHTTGPRLTVDTSMGRSDGGSDDFLADRSVSWRHGQAWSVTEPGVIQLDLHPTGAFSRLIRLRVAGGGVSLAGIELYGTLHDSMAQLGPSLFPNNDSYVEYLLHVVAPGSKVVALQESGRVKPGMKGVMITQNVGTPPLLCWWPELQVTTWLDFGDVNLAVGEPWLCLEDGCELENKASCMKCDSCGTPQPLPQVYGSALANTPEALLALPERYAAQVLDAFSSHYDESEGKEEEEAQAAQEALEAAESTPEPHGWRCPACSFHNEDPDAEWCEICEGARPEPGEEEPEEVDVVVEAQQEAELMRSDSMEDEALGQIVVEDDSSSIGLDSDDPETPEPRRLPPAR